MNDRAKLLWLVWGSAAGGFLLFAVLLTVFGGLAGGVGRILLLALVSLAISSGAAHAIGRGWVADQEEGAGTSPSLTETAAGSQVSSRKDSAADLIREVGAGNLTLTSAQIAGSTRSTEMSAAIRGLVLKFERTINRFSQLANDVGSVSEQIAMRARLLAQNAADQLNSAEATASSVSQIDRSINNVQKSMENLSLNAEETSTSVLQMSASIEEVRKISDTLSEFVEQTASAIEEMIASINEVATNT
ncbi:MAG TPA: methyl-accepting chemotaxis protein, partial [Thermoanaerobaculia bacterium]|nr:methyl-accepting chemotaxis protein [Thermoanaerobaculia bacterium]